MTQPIHYLLLLLMLATVTTGCQKESTKQATLTGTWNWKSTDGGLAHHVHQTPATTGQWESLQLGTDNQYVRYTNNVISERGTYSITEAICIHDGEKKKVVTFSGSSLTLMIEKLDGAQLVFADEHYDGVVMLYERKKEHHN